MTNTDTGCKSSEDADSTCDVEPGDQGALDEILDELCVTVAGAYELAIRKWKREKNGDNSYSDCGERGCACDCGDCRGLEQG